MTYGEVCGMGKRELALWLAKFKLDPSPAEQLPTLIAALCSVVANTAFGSKGKAKVEDFLIDWRAKPKSKEEAQLQNADAWMRWAAAENAAAKKG